MHWQTFDVLDLISSPIHFNLLTSAEAADQF